jgi:hypothetical protein
MAGDNMMRGILAACALVLAAGLSTAAIGQARAETLLFHASSSGKQTLDQGEGGGNPFASSLIDVLAQPHAALRDLPATLQRLTVQKSGGFQTPDVPAGVARPDWSLVPATSGERRIALVLVVSDYSASGGAPSLDGAKTDAARIASALQRAGFTTEVALDFDLASMRRKLADFASRSAEADAAAIYVTGHGVEVGRTVYLLPGDYPVALKDAALHDRAIRLADIAGLPRARQVNLVFYGGCRDNPFE